MAAEADAAGLIIINNSSDCLYPDIEENSTDVLSHIFIASTPLDDAAQDLIDAALASVDSETPLLASYSSIQTHILDPAALVLLCMAVVTIVVAAAWAGSDYKRALAKQELSDSLNTAADDQLAGSTGQEGVQHVLRFEPAHA